MTRTEDARLAVVETEIRYLIVRQDEFQTDLKGLRGDISKLLDYHAVLDNERASQVALREASTNMKVWVRWTPTLVLAAIASINLVFFVARLIVTGEV